MIYCTSELTRFYEATRFSAVRWHETCTSPIATIVQQLALPVNGASAHVRCTADIHVINLTQLLRGLEGIWVISQIGQKASVKNELAKIDERL